MLFSQYCLNKPFDFREIRRLFAFITLDLYQMECMQRYLRPPYNKVAQARCFYGCRWGVAIPAYFFFQMRFAFFSHFGFGGAGGPS